MAIIINGNSVRPLESIPDPIHLEKFPKWILAYMRRNIEKRFKDFSFK